MEAGLIGRRSFFANLNYRFSGSRLCCKKSFIKRKANLRLGNRKTSLLFYFQNVILPTNASLLTMKNIFFNTVRIKKILLILFVFSSLNISGAAGENEDAEFWENIQRAIQKGKRFSEHWMYRGELGYREGQKFFMTGLQYRFGF